ncbi:hypothetical protein KSP39_PZI020784 [Platanthera zijinensis]|uniref:Uncharacterized protein n=1 Tax=Platanthera zijinensis TaxID=2320716 RepID=A0AAP0B0Z5_9ASPA
MISSLNGDPLRGALAAPLLARPAPLGGLALAGLGNNSLPRRSRSTPSPILSFPGRLPGALPSPSAGVISLRSLGGSSLRSPGAGPWGVSLHAKSMASSVSSPKPLEEEHNLDKLVAELHSLKKLYGLLQKNSDGQVPPDQPSAHLLDEKSSDLLKKLLDDATQQVFDCQAKIISCSSEISKSQPKSNTNPPAEKSPEPVITGPQTEQKPLINSCPTPEPVLKQASFQHRGGEKSNRRKMNRPSQSKNTKKPSQPLRRTSSRLKSIRSDSSNGRRSSEKGGDFLALVPVQKRPRVEPVQLSSRVSSSSTKPHHKKNARTDSIREQDPIQPLHRTSSSINRASKVAPLADRTAEIVHRNDRDIRKAARLNRLKARRCVSSNDSSWSNSGSISGSNSSSSSIYSTRRRKPSPITSTARIAQKNDRVAEKKSGAIKQIKLAPSKHGSSRSNGHLIPSKQSRARVEKKGKEEQGKLRRLTNKLAVIFHHHHHHHLHAGEDGRSSLWKHFKTVLHLGRGNGEERAAKERRHGYLRVMIEGLLQQLWGMRWRRKKMARRRASKKQRCWAWFRRRGGVAVGGRRRVRLRLGHSDSGRRIASGRRLDVGDGVGGQAAEFEVNVEDFGKLGELPSDMLESAELSGWGGPIPMRRKEGGPRGRGRASASEQVTAFSVSYRSQ